MKKRLAVLAISLMLVLTGCGGTTTTTYKNGEKTYWDKFIVIERYENDSDRRLNIAYDKDTKVEYYIISEYYGYAICPVYNADGTIKVYEGE